MNAPDGHDVATRLPEGWATARVSDLVRFVTSGSRGWGEYYSESGARFIRVGDFSRGAISLNLDEMAHVEPPAGSEGERTAVQAGDVLLTITADVGMVAVAPKALGPAYVNQHVALIRPLDGIDGRAFAYGLLDPVGFQQVVREAQYGATKAGLSLLQLREFEVKVPPQGEQPRIVDALDSFLTRLDAATDGLKRIESNLKRYRASVLKAATEGRLVPTEADLAKQEGRDYQPASDLLVSILRERRQRWELAEIERMTSRGQPPTNDKWKDRYEDPAPPEAGSLHPLPEGWCWATAQQLGETVTGTTPVTARTELYASEGLPFFKPTDLDAGYFTKIARQHISLEGRTHVRILPASSVLVTCIGATIGKTGLARTECATNQQINALVPADAIRADRYLFWFFESPFGRASVVGNASSTTLPILNKGRFEQIAVPLPPLAEQRRIVAELEGHDAIAEAVTSMRGRAERRIARLRRSILKWAFEGKLVDQDPSDEPASLLLDRVRRERAVAAPEKIRSARASVRKTA